MTTVLADARLGVMVSDSIASDDDRVYPNVKKVYRIKGRLFGFAGAVAEFQQVVAWLKEGAQGKPPRLREVQMMMLCKDGLFLYDPDMSPILCQSGIEAIGTGAKSALCAYEAMGHENPVKAVQIVCKYDMASRLPVKVYKL